LVGELRAHQDRVFTTDFWPENTAVVTPSKSISLAVSGGYDNQIIFWDLGKKRPLYVFENAHSSWVRRVRFNETGTLLASGGYDNRLRIWNTTNLPNRRPTLVANLSGHTDAINGLVFVPQANPTAGEFVISGGRDGVVIVWDVTNPQQPIRRATLQNGPTDKVYDLAVSPNGRLLAVAGADSVIYLYDITNPGFPSSSPVRVLDGHTTEVNSIAFSPDGTLLASGDDAGRIILWRVATGENLGTLAGHANWILSLDFHPEGQILASASRDNTILLWDVPTLTRLSGPFVAHEDWVWEARFNETGDQLLSAGRDNLLYLWSLFVSEQLDVKLANFDTAVVSLAYEPDEIVGVGTAVGEVWAWPVTATLSAATVPITTWALADWPALPEETTLRVAQRRNHVAAVVGEDILLWPLTPDNLAPAPQTLRGHSSLVRDIAFSSDGRYLASVGCVGEAVDVTSIDAELSENAPLGSEAAVGQVLPSDLPPCTTSEVRLWEAATGTAVLDAPLQVAESELISLAFSPDDSVLMTGGCQRLAEPSPAQDMAQQQEAGDKNLCQAGETILWQIDEVDTAVSVRELRRFSQVPLSGQALQSDFIDHVALSHDNAVLATTSTARTLAFWDVASGEPLSAPLSGHTGLFNALAFSPDDSLLVTV
ncbi:MAG: WD40 repeat domain-containing protein, partial [Anaerolineales bacterium]|nr:WD40 repeat domain-containing protein [Anaerolineales bacterium]